MEPYIKIEARVKDIPTYKPSVGFLIPVRVDRVDFTGVSDIPQDRIPEFRENLMHTPLLLYKDILPIFHRDRIRAYLDYRGIANIEHLRSPEIPEMIELLSNEGVVRAQYLR